MEKIKRKEKKLEWAHQWNAAPDVLCAIWDFGFDKSDGDRWRRNVANRRKKVKDHIKYYDHVGSEWTVAKSAFNEGFVLLRKIKY